MKRLLAPVVLLATLIAPITAALGDEPRDGCENFDHDPAQRIADCTAALEDANLAKDERAILLNHRAQAHSDRAEYAKAQADFAAALTDASALDRLTGALLSPFVGGNNIDATQPYGAALLGKAWSEISLAQYDQAAADARSAGDWFRSPPWDSEVYTALAFIDREKGDTAAAEADYRQSLEIDPENDNSEFFYAVLLFDLGHNDEALSRLQHSIARDNRYGYKALWVYLHAPNRDAEGKPALRAYLATVEGDAWPAPLARYYLGEIDADAVRTIAAQGATPTKVQENLCETEYYFAEALRFAGKDDEARRHYQAAVDTGITWYIEYMSAKHLLALH